MILVDLSQVMFANVFEHTKHNKSASLDLNEDLLRHSILNSLRSYSKKFKHKYGKMVVCCDSKHYWRKDVFPNYKSRRKKKRDTSGLDWGTIFESMTTIKEELKQFFPHKVVEVYGAEADDVIAVLTKRLSEDEEILIISSDKDFAQLQKYSGVRQYSPIIERFVEVESPENFVKELIIRGDFDDDVPNILSSDDVFIKGERQKSINTKKLLNWMQEDHSEFCITEEMKHGWKRNRQLIDLDFIPENIRENILSEFDRVEPAPINSTLEYFFQKGVKNLIRNLDEF